MTGLVTDCIQGLKAGEWRMMTDFLLERPGVLLTDLRKLGRQPMLGKQLVNLLLKTGVRPH